jgi:hypothetical protein
VEIRDQATGRQSLQRLEKIGQHTRRLLPGLHIRRDQPDLTWVISPLTLANHTNKPQTIHLTFHTRDTKSGWPVGEEQRSIQVSPYLNQNLLLTETLKEILPPTGDWTITVTTKAETSEYGLIGNIKVDGHTRWVVSTGME